MLGKRAKILSDTNIRDLLAFAGCTRNPLRNRVIVLLSVKAGLRAGEIASLTWSMVTDPTGEIGAGIALEDRAAKKNSGRVIPLHSELQDALVELRRTMGGDGPVIKSERRRAMTTASIVNWFTTAYQRSMVDQAEDNKALTRNAPNSDREQRQPPEPRDRSVPLHRDEMNRKTVPGHG